MELIVVPTLILRFLLMIGCVPTMAVYEVDKPPMLGGKEYPGIYCPEIEGDYCPEAGMAYIYKDAPNYSDVLVHELYHSCQSVPRGRGHWHMNELQAQAVTQYWREWRTGYGSY